MVVKDKVSIIVPVYNNRDGLAKALASIRELRDESFEIIVVDDASLVSYDDLCKTHEAHLVRLPTNAGPGNARNQGTMVATGEIFAFTDSDCTVPPNWLLTIRKGLATDSSTVAVAGGYSGEHVSGLVPSTRFLEASYYHLQERKYVNTFVTANFAIRRQVFEEVGKFPKAYFGEDLLLGIKLRERGYAVLWLPELRVGQFFRSTFPAYFKQQLNWSCAAALISARHPQTQSLIWSVRRSSLFPQLALELLLLVSALFLLIGVTSEVCLVLGTVGLLLSLAGLLGCNLGFLRFVYARQGLARTFAVFLVIVFGRNPAWLLGCLKAVLLQPRMMVGGLTRMLVSKLPRLGRKSGCQELTA
jgi:glycosyltransferase involved in cell wall biosynthesis